MISLRVVIFIVTTCFCSVLNAQANEVNRGFLVQVGDQVDNLTLDLLGEGEIALSDLKGKVVVLQFTASWCSVCRKEMPHLENEVWIPNKEDDFILIGVDIDEDTSKIAPFIEKMQVTYPIAVDSNKSIFHYFAAKGAGVTRNVVIDQTGKIVFLTRLFDEEEFDLMKNKIASLLQ